MLGLFYPETNERYMPFKEFESVDEAQIWMSQTNGWIKETPQGDDVFAWINTFTGDILVLRQLKVDEDGDITEDGKPPFPDFPDLPDFPRAS
jgi:hypothetical protein